MCINLDCEVRLEWVIGLYVIEFMKNNIDHSNKFSDGYVFTKIIVLTDNIVVPLLVSEMILIEMFRNIKVLDE